MYTFYQPLDRCMFPLCVSCDKDDDAEENLYIASSPDLIGGRRRREGARGVREGLEEEQSSC